MNGYMAFGILAGVVVGLILVIVLLKVTKKDGDMKCKFDERQANIRGKGFKISFFTLLVYNGIYGLLGILLEKPFLDPLAAMMIGICLAVAVHVVYCIWQDAYFFLNENPKKVLIVFGILAAINLSLGIVNIATGEATTGGVLNFRSTNLMCGILFILIFAALLAKRIKNRNDAKRETV